MGTHAWKAKVWSTMQKLCGPVASEYKLGQVNINKSHGEQSWRSMVNDWFRERSRWYDIYDLLLYSIFNLFIQ